MMDSLHKPSPRQEALYAILETSASLDRVLIDEVAWERLITLAWDNRSHVGDRREIRRQIRNILIESDRAGR